MGPRGDTGAWRLHAAKHDSTEQTHNVVLSTHNKQY